MGERVAVVEDLAQARLLEVGCDDIGLDLHCSLDELGQHRATHVECRFGRRLDDLEDALVADEPALDDLREAGGDVARRQCLDGLEVSDDGERLVEGAHEILALRDVDAGLAADRGVDHGEHRRRRLNDADTP